MGLIVRILDGFCRWLRCCWVGDCWGEMKVYESHFSENSILTDFFLFLTFLSDVSGEVWGAVLPVSIPQGTHSVSFRKRTSLLGLPFRRGYSVPLDKICKSNDKSM